MSMVSHNFSATHSWHSFGTDEECGNPVCYQGFWCRGGNPFPLGRIIQVPRLVPGARKTRPAVHKPYNETAERRTRDSAQQETRRKDGEDLASLMQKEQVGDSTCAYY